MNNIVVYAIGFALGYGASQEPLFWAAAAFVGFVIVTLSVAK